MWLPTLGIDLVYLIGGPVMDRRTSWRAICSSYWDWISWNVLDGSSLSACTQGLAGRKQRGDHLQHVRHVRVSLVRA